MKNYKTNTFIINGDVTTVISTKGRKFLIDTEDMDKVSKYYWGAHLCSGWFYIKASDNTSRHTFLPNYLLDVKTNDFMVIDHINHNRLDNRKSNLRLVTKSVNSKNRSKGNGKPHSTYAGVTHNKSSKNKAWVAQLSKRTNGEQNCYYLGSYKTEKKAALAYDAKARELNGDMANLNFP